MHGGLQPVDVWTQVPVANRTVEVNTKTGFSLTAGSYSVRASSVQTGTVQLAGVTSNTSTISSVTVTRTTLRQQGQTGDSANNTATDQYLLKSVLTNGTTVTVTKTTSTNNAGTTYDVCELY